MKKRKLRERLAELEDAVECLRTHLLQVRQDARDFRSKILGMVDRPPVNDVYIKKCKP